MWILSSFHVNPFNHVQNTPLPASPTSSGRRFHPEVKATVKRSSHCRTKLFGGFCFGIVCALGSLSVFFGEAQQQLYNAIHVAGKPMQVIPV